MEELCLNPIGTIHSPHSDPVGMPIQPGGAKDIIGSVDILSEYAEGLADLEGFSHLVLLYHFHLAKRTELKVVPFLDKEMRGVFATRSPLRPNHIGMSVVELLEVNGNTLKVRGLDILDGSPLLDIKPFVDFFDNRETRNGWLTNRHDKVQGKRSDTRFTR